MSITQELELSIDEALSGIAEIDAALQQSAEVFKVALTDALGVLGETQVVENVDASPVESAVGSALGESFAEEFSVDNVDASPVESAVTDALAVAEGEPIEVTADTSQAQAAIDELGISSDKAAASTDNAASSVGGLGVAVGLAQGKVGGLGEALKSSGGSTAALAGGALAVGAALGVFFSSGLKAIAGTERLQTVFGTTAAAVQQIDIGGLTGDMSDLARESGNSGAQLRSAAAGLGQIALSSGASKEAAKDFTQQVSALALRATALNPSLGEAGDVATRLGTALSRGGRFAAQFGLSLTPAQINARALADTGKSAAAELTIYEKSAAGAAIATEQLGSSLGKDFNKGTQQAAVQIKALKAELSATIAEMGKPLVPPLLDVFEQLVPLAQSLARAIGSVAQSAMPALTAAVGAVVPILEVLAGVVEALPDPLLASGVAAIGLGRAFGPVGAIIGALTPLLAAFGEGFASAAISIGLMAVAGGKLAGAIPGVSTGLGVATGAGVALGQAIGGAEGNAISLASAGAGIGTAIAPGIGTAIGAVAGLAAGFLTGGQSAAEAKAEIQGLSRELDNLSRKEGTRRFLEEEIDLLQLAQQNYEDLEQDVRDLAESSPAAAEKIVEGLREIGPSIGITNAELDKLDRILEKGVTTYRNNAVAGKEAAQTNRDIANEATGATAAQKALDDATSALSSSIQTSVPAAGAVFDGFASDVRSAFGEQATPSVQGFVDRLNQSVGETQAWIASINSLLQGGLLGLAALVQSQGPGSALAAEIAAATPEQRTAWNAAIEAGTTALTQLDSEAKRKSAETAAGILGNLNLLPPGVVPIGKQTGTNVAQGLQSTGPPAAATAGDATFRAIMSALSLTGVAYAAGASVGIAIGQGMVDGLARAHGPMSELARRIVRDAEAAARREAQSDSPSKLFAAVGRDMGLGMAQGLDKSAQEVQSASQALVNAATPSVRQEAPLTLVRSSAGTAALGGAASQLGGSSVVSDTRTTTINVTGVTDPRVAAELVSREQRFNERYAGVS